jgi:hypothetical protein
MQIKITANCVYLEKGLRTSVFIALSAMNNIATYICKPIQIDGSAVLCTPTERGAFKIRGL